jgi:hypothetical protein
MDGERLEIRGRLRLVGSARYAEYVVTPPDNYDVYLDLDRVKSAGLVEYSGRYVRAKGRMRVRPMYAPGRKFVHWRYEMDIDGLRLEE